jgi:hypothetical protein
MDHDRVDHIARALSHGFLRRAIIGAVGPAVLAAPALVDARKKRRKKKKKKTPPDQRQVQFNAFGCVNVGSFCESSSQCCSGICQGSTCRGHNVDVCQAGQAELFCSDSATEIACTGEGGAAGSCGTTTGNAGFCVRDRKCFACTKDADCQTASTCGAGAACVICANCVDAGGTACVASDAAGCA